MPTLAFNHRGRVSASFSKRVGGGGREKKGDKRRLAREIALCLGGSLSNANVKRETAKEKGSRRVCRAAEMNYVRSGERNRVEGRCVGRMSDFLASEFLRADFSRWEPAGKKMFRFFSFFFSFSWNCQ